MKKPLTLPMDVRLMQWTASLMFVLAFIMCVASGIGWLLRHPAFSIQGITVRGNVAHSSGGPRCVKYGTTRDYVLNLEVVLPTGEIIQTGANVLKNSTGYNLTQLMVGSEGTLGIITKITLKLLPFPPYNTLLLAAFDSALDAFIASISFCCRRLFSASALATFFLLDSTAAAAALKYFTLSDSEA